jgi:RNA polymerase primary sigma factor
MNTLRLYLQEMGNFPLLTADEEKDLARRYKNDGDMEARDWLINCNLKLVVSIAKKYHNSHLELMDLISYGNMGLMQAVDKFDPELGYRFTTCATPWIKQAITKAIIDSGKSIRVPAHIYQLLAKYRKAVEELTKDGKGQPTQEQIAMYMGVSNDKIRELEEWRHDTVSLSTPLGDDSEDTLEDLQADNYSETPMKYVERKAKEEMIQALIATLKPRTQTIIKMRFGLGNDNDPEEFKKEHTLEEIGAYLGITRERVRQIEKQTLAELKLKWDGSY